MSPLVGMELPDQLLASFGKDAAVGCFLADGPLELPRHAPVLLQTPRGLEVGHVLGPATIRQARLVGAHVRGTLVRALTPDDAIGQNAAENLSRELLFAAERLVASSTEDLAKPMSLIDAEVLFDRTHALLHVLHPNPDELGPFTEALSQITGLDIRLVNLAAPMPTDDPADDHGCGKPDCGSGDGGCTSCSTGGCSTGCGSGSVDLKPYFANLRDQMEASNRTPLV